jgi:hypothetical protein
MTRLLSAATAALLLASSAVCAQAPALENRDLSPWSPLTYERLGATPKIQWRKAPPAVARPGDDARTSPAPRADAAKAVATAPATAASSTPAPNAAAAVAR